MTPNPPRARPFPHAFDRLWHIASAPPTFLALAGLLAATLALAAIIPQQPSGLAPAAAEGWLAATAAGYRQGGPFLRAVGAFTLLDSLWMRLLLAATGFHLALRLAEHLRAARNTLRPAQIAPPPAGLPAVEARLDEPLAAAVARITELLQARYPVALVTNDTARAQVYVERRRASAWAPALALGGALLILAGLLVDDALGWRGSELALAPGGSAEVAEHAQVEVTVREVDGPLTAPQARVTLSDARGRTDQWLAFGWPARLGNLWVAQRGTGPALTITAKDASGGALPLQELVAGGAASETLHVLFQQTEGEQAIAIPARNLALRVVAYSDLPDQGDAQPVILAEVFRGVDPVPVAGELVEGDTTLVIEDTTITLHRDRYVVLAASYLPGLWLLLAGALLILAGAIWWIGWGGERAWVDLAANRDGAGIAARVAARTDARGRAERLLAACIAREAPDAG